MGARRRNKEPLTVAADHVLDLTQFVPHGTDYRREIDDVADIMESNRSFRWRFGIRDVFSDL